MTDQLISFKTAKLAKEKGFNFTTGWPSLGRRWYTTKQNEYTLIPEGTLNAAAEGIPAPTQSLLQKWLREKHNIHIVVIPFARDSSTIKSKSDYYVYVNKKQFYGFINLTTNNTPYNSYEEALEQGLIEALKLIQL